MFRWQWLPPFAWLRRAQSAAGITWRSPAAADSPVVILPPAAGWREGRANSQSVGAASATAEHYRRLPAPSGGHESRWASVVLDSALQLLERPRELGDRRWSIRTSHRAAMRQPGGSLFDIQM